MDNFFALFRRYLNDKAKGNAVYVCKKKRKNGKNGLKGLQRAY